MAQGPMLTKDQIDKFSSQMVKNGLPVRFLYNGQALNIETGELSSKGSNVMYHPVYWNFTKETAKEIAKDLGVKAVFDEEDGVVTEGKGQNESIGDNGTIVLRKNRHTKKYHPDTMRDRDIMSNWPDFFRNGFSVPEDKMDAFISMVSKDGYDVTAIEDPLFVTKTRNVDRPISESSKKDFGPKSFMLSESDHKILLQDDDDAEIEGDKTQVYTSEDGVKFWGELDSDMNAWICIAQAEGYPASQAWDEWFGKKEDAEDVCKRLANGEL